MKTFFSLLLALPLFLTPFRATASSDIHAPMEVVYASGFYSTMRSGILALNFDGTNDRPTSITFTAEGRKIKASINEVRFGLCGDRYLARIHVPNERTATDLELVDYTQIRCRLYVREKWHATISTSEPDGSVSRVDLVGNPTP